MSCYSPTFRHGRNFVQNWKSFLTRYQNISETNTTVGAATTCKRLKEEICRLKQAHKLSTLKREKIWRWRFFILNTKKSLIDKFSGWIFLVWSERRNYSADLIKSERLKFVFIIVMLVLSPMFCTLHYFYYCTWYYIAKQTSNPKQVTYSVTYMLPDVGPILVRTYHNSKWQGGDIHVTDIMNGILGR